VCYVNQMTYEQRKMVIAKRLLPGFFAVILVASSCGSSTNDRALNDALAELAAAETERDAAIIALEKSTEALETTDAAPESPSTTETSPSTTESPATVATTTTAPEATDEMVLTFDYAWMESSEAVAALQELIGVNADGVYGSNTRRAHYIALVAAGLTTSDLAGCVPMLKSDRSLFGIQIATDMETTIEFMVQTCGEMNEVVIYEGSPDFPSDLDGTAWYHPCSYDSYDFTHRSWGEDEEEITLSFVRIGDGGGFIGWESRPALPTFPSGVSLGMATVDVLNILGLNADNLKSPAMHYPGMDGIEDWFDDWDQIIHWGQAPEDTTLPIFEGHGMPYNASELEFTDGVLSGWDVSPYSVCQ